VAGQVFAAAGMTSESQRFAAEGARYRADILESMRRATIEKDGMRLLPIEPDTHRLLKASDYRGGDYYGLVASSLLENGFLRPESEEARLLTDALESRKGLILGMCEFMEGIDHAYTYGYWRTQLERDDVRKVLLGFWGTMAYGMTQDTYSPVECTYQVLGENHYTLPHTYSCTQQLRLLRDMLVHEEGDVLWLAKAMPREWLKPLDSAREGAKLVVEDAPTTFGPVSYTLACMDGSEVYVELKPPVRSAPREVRLRIRHPEGRKIKQVEPESSAIRVEGDTLVVTGATEPGEMIVRF
jgi:hypothetical protein